MEIQLDKWQEEVLAAEGNILVRTGRQCGKSTVISIKAARYAATNPKKSILVISSTERQAYLLFSKILAYLIDHHKSLIKIGKDRPTKSEVKLKNGSIIRCLPTGLDGSGIRGYTVDLLIEDESRLIPDDVQTAVKPMLLTTNGWHWKLGTPAGKEGHFYQATLDPKFKQFHITSEQVAQERPEPLRTYMLQYLESEKKAMSEVQYAQEYLAIFQDEIKQFFKDELIKKCTILKRRAPKNTSKHYLGVDVGGLGEDPSAYATLEQINDDIFEHIENQLTEKTYTDEVVQTIINLNKTYNYKKIYIDDGGIGFGVFSYLLKEDSTKTKTVAINNSSRPVTWDKTKKTGLMKEELYFNMLAMMEKGHLRLLDDDEVRASLKSVQQEIVRVPGRPTRLIIYGNNTHITEALIRASWINQEKSLNLWAA